MNKKTFKYLKIIKSKKKNNKNISDISKGNKNRKMLNDNKKLAVSNKYNGKKS
jgi:hypothetical protein